MARQNFLNWEVWSRYTLLTWKLVHIKTITLLFHIVYNISLENSLCVKNGSRSPISYLMLVFFFPRVKRGLFFTPLAGFGKSVLFEKIFTSETFAPNKRSWSGAMLTFGRFSILFEMISTLGTYLPFTKKISHLIIELSPETF